MPDSAPFGSWPSPLTAEVIVQASVGLGGPAIVGDEIWWSELRPAEGGRVQIVRKPLAGDPSTAHDVLPEGFSARTRVHEYGGGAWWLHGTTLFFANWADQRLYRLDDGAVAPVAITAEAPAPGSFRYADGRVTPDGRWVVCVREWHGAPGAAEPRNQIVALPADGSAEPTVLVGGDEDPEPADFVSHPRVSPDGTKLRWLQWHHPDMPWDATEVGIARLSLDGDRPTLINARGDGRPGRVSVAQPEWSPAGFPYSVRDDDGWWRIWFDGHDPGPITPAGAEWAQPQWVFGQSWYTFTADGRGIVAAFRANGIDRLAWIPATGGFEGGEGLFTWGDPVVLHVPYTAIDGVTAGPEGVVGFIGSSFTGEPEVVTIDTAELDGTLVPATVHRPARDLGIDPELWSVPEHLSVATTDGETAYALFYPPRNPEVAGPEGQLPPLVVMGHGGPTAAARPQLNLGVQFWTTRGFAVVDVNYRGSTGYGRAFREALNGQWGIADVEDCIATARQLAEDGLVDGARLVIRGGSAGGYTVLRALTLTGDFAAGCSLYGIADLEALAADTHKFESRYTDRLVGPYPEAKDLYVERSPLHHVDDLATPLLILQGLEDEIVPPAQAEMMVAALRAKGVPFAYLAFEGEQHGFRQATTIRRALESELYFYGRVLGFDPADAIEPIPVEFL